MAVKSEETTASAMQVVIRRHLACVSLTVKIGPRRSPGAPCGERTAGVVMFEREGASWRAHALRPHGLHPLCPPETELSPRDTPRALSPERGCPPALGPAGPKAAFEQGEEPWVWVPDPCASTPCASRPRASRPSRIQTLCIQTPCIWARGFWS